MHFVHDPHLLGTDIITAECSATDSPLDDVTDPVLTAGDMQVESTGCDTGCDTCGGKSDAADAKISPTEESDSLALVKDAIANILDSIGILQVRIDNLEMAEFLKNDPHACTYK